MQTRVRELGYRLERILQVHENVTSKDTFCVFYGSYADNVDTDESDIDLFIANPTRDKELFIALENGVIDFHKEKNIPLDEEVPYSNKLLITFEELEMAASLNGMGMINNKFFVPTLKRTEEYLGSKQIKLRLIFNALSKPHYVLKDNDYYRSTKDNVSESLFWLAVDLLDTPSFHINEIIDILFKGKNLRQGEEYLGYERYPKVIETIRGRINEEVSRLNKKRMISYDIETRNIAVLDNSKLEALKRDFIGSSGKLSGAS